MNNSEEAARKIANAIVNEYKGEGERMPRLNPIIRLAVAAALHEAEERVKGEIVAWLRDWSLGWEPIGSERAGILDYAATAIERGDYNKPLRTWKDK